MYVHTGCRGVKQVPCRTPESAVHLGPSDPRGSCTSVLQAVMGGGRVPVRGREEGSLWPSTC